MTLGPASALASMDGYSFPVLYSRDAQAQAEQVAVRCEWAYQYLRRVLEFTPNVRLLLLSPHDWATYADVPL